MDYLLPGLWSGEVSLHNEHFVEIHIEADVHLQLFQDPDDSQSVIGWLYITTGTVYLEGLVFDPCIARLVRGTVEPVDNGILIPCLEIDGAEEAPCIAVEADENGASFSASRFLFSLGGELPEYEGLADRDRDIFSCL